MKKALLFGFASLSLFAVAQNKAKFSQNEVPMKRLSKPFDMMSEGASSGASFMKGGPSLVQPFGVGTIDLGSAFNVFTAVSGPRTTLWADPTLKTVLFIHRANTNVVSGSTS